MRSRRPVLALAALIGILAIACDVSCPSCWDMLDERKAECQRQFGVDTVLGFKCTTGVGGCGTVTDYGSCYAGGPGQVPREFLGPL